ncbi:hypothetical protein L345_04539, partial [Ophiophagus hannah]
MGNVECQAASGQQREIFYQCLEQAEKKEREKTVNLPAPRGCPVLMKHPEPLKPKITRGSSNGKNKRKGGQAPEACGFLPSVFKTHTHTPSDIQPRGGQPAIAHAAALEITSLQCYFREVTQLTHGNPFCCANQLSRYSLDFTQTGLNQQNPTRGYRRTAGCVAAIRLSWPHAENCEGFVSPMIPLVQWKKWYNTTFIIPPELLEKVGRATSVWLNGAKQQSPQTPGVDRLEGKKEGRKKGGGEGMKILQYPPPAMPTKPRPPCHAMPHPPSHAHRTGKDKLRIQKDLDRLEQRVLSNGMKFNVEKSEVLHLGRKNQRHKHRLTGSVAPVAVEETGEGHCPARSSEEGPGPPSLHPRAHREERIREQWLHGLWGRKGP